MKYEYKYEVVYDKAFREELYDLIIDHRDKHSKIKKKLEFYTRLLAEQGQKVLPTEKAFEKVKGTSNIYELRLLRNPNLRILLTFCDTNKIVFLTIFYEKGTKKDYSRYIKIAEGRLKNNC
jgi:mRNA-degrading endonuclease RelE of RelBE toxin-antitoxin system